MQPGWAVLASVLKGNAQDLQNHHRIFDALGVRTDRWGRDGLIGAALTSVFGTA